MMNANPIGVFDSGVGGLTVLRALREVLPHEDFVYLGDTARLPYGAKSHDTVAQYGLQAAQFLMQDGIKLLVVACNTASALALPELQKALPQLPCLGVIEPGAETAAQASHSGNIAVLATESTVRSGAYAQAIKKRRADADVQMLACNLLIAFAEEGWCEGDEAEAAVKKYLRMLKPGFDTLVLGCTHFPLLTETIRKLLPPAVNLIDSAASAAQNVRAYLNAHTLANTQKQPGNTRFYVTDSPERFNHVAKRFLKTDMDVLAALAYLAADNSSAQQAAKTVKAS